MVPEEREVTYEFVPYGTEFEPQKDILVLDVGMKTVPGVIDHHHPHAEPECTASLIAKHPFLIRDHIPPDKSVNPPNKPSRLHIITHRLPDFDAVASIFLALKLLETGECDSCMNTIAQYTKMVDSASLPKEWDLPSTPYSILRALFLKIRKKQESAYLERVKQGLSFMNFLYSKSKEGYDIRHNKSLFSGIDRYEKAIRRAEEDYFNYLYDQENGQKIILHLPLTTGSGAQKVDGLIVRNPHSYLLKDWARRDRIHSSLKQGYSFVMTIFGNKRYILGVDPERGVNLKGLGDLLNHKETEKREEQGRPLSLRWYDGNCPFFNYRIIDSPQDESSLTHQEIVNTVKKFSRMNEK